MTDCDPHARSSPAEAALRPVDRSGDQARDDCLLRTRDLYDPTRSLRPDSSSPAAWVWLARHLAACMPILASAALLARDLEAEGCQRLLAGALDSAGVAAISLASEMPFVLPSKIWQDPTEVSSPTTSSATSTD